MTDPTARPHGGETIAELVVRVRALLDDLHAGPSEEVVAVTHGSVIRAAVAVVLDASPSAFWRIEAAPLSLTEFHVRGSWWVLEHANYLHER
jgi:broad specificity phosphatase PhoE